MPALAAIRKVAFLGDYLPRKCGIATFTTDLRCAVAAESPALQCLVVRRDLIRLSTRGSMND
jgi:hypothetical protein